MKVPINIDLPEGRFMRLLTEADVNQTYVDALNDKSRVQHMVSVQGSTSYEDAVEYVRHNNDTVGTYLFGIFEGKSLLGTTRLHYVDQESKSAHMGIFIFANDPSKKGLGTAVIENLCDYAFSKLDIERIHAGIFVDNIASSRAFAKAGFKVHDSADYHGRQYQKWIKVQ